MTDPASLMKTIDSASKVANTPLITTIIDKVTGFKLSKWAAEGEVRKKIIHDEYEKAKDNGIIGMQYIEYMRSTENLISTAEKSAKYIDPNKQNEIKMDNDFFWNTIEYAKTVSSDEMQELVAKIIAGEYIEPGSYSISTLQTLKMLGRSDLELFENVGSLLLSSSDIPSSLFSKTQAENSTLDRLNIAFQDLQELQSFGLILPNVVSWEYPNKEMNLIEFIYFDEVLHYKPSFSIETNFTSSFYVLSKTGHQIMQHLNPSFQEDYYYWLRNEFIIPNYSLVE